MAPVAVPLGLDFEPGVIDHPLPHLGQDPARVHCRRDVLAQHVDVRLDRHRLARRAGKVRRHAKGHDEMRVKPDED